MLPQTQLPQIPDYVAYNMQKLLETGINDFNLREVGRLLIDWHERYGDDKEYGGYDKCLETVEWLSEHSEHYYQIRDMFLKSNKINKLN